MLKKEDFDYLLEMEIKRSNRYRSFFSLALVELDRANGKKNGAMEKRAGVVGSKTCRTSVINRSVST